jgi:hypothetical protein
MSQLNSNPNLGYKPQNQSGSADVPMATWPDAMLCAPLTIGLMGIADSTGHCDFQTPVRIFAEEDGFLGGDFSPLRRRLR